MRLSLACAAVSAVLVVFLVSLATATSPRNTLVDQSGAIIAGQLANSASEYVVEGDKLALQTLLKELTRGDLIAYANIEDAEHRLLVESGSRGFNQKTMRQFTSTIQVHDSVVGHVKLNMAGAASPAMSAVLVLLLGATVFSLVLLFVLFRLRALDQALQQMGATLDVLLPGESHQDPVKSVADIHLACEAMRQLVPAPSPRAANNYAVMAIRLPALAKDALPQEQLCSAAELVEHAAERWQGLVAECADGWLLQYTTGDDTPLRLLASARYLQAVLDSQLSYAMAMGVESEGAMALDDRRRRFQWQALCDSTRELACQHQALVLTRLTLCNNGIHPRVTVEQDEAGLYQVTGFSEEVEQPLTDELQEEPETNLQAVSR